MAVKWLNRTLVYAPAHYGLCLNEDSFRKTLKKLGIKEYAVTDYITSNEQAVVHYLESSNFKETGHCRICCIVCLDDSKLSFTQVASTLTHEAVHVWQKVSDMLGEFYPSKEFEAYSIGNITWQLMNAYQESEQGKKKLLEAAAKVRLKQRKPKRRKTK